MRVFLTFFLFVCFHLLGGLGNAYTSNYVTSSRAAAHTLPKLQESTGEHQLAFIAPGTQNGHSPFSYNLFEDENEEEQDSAPRRYILPLDYFSAFYQAFIATNFSGASGCRQFFFEEHFFNFPAKYLMYRSIRI